MDKPVAIITQKRIYLIYIISLLNVHGLRFIENSKLITSQSGYEPLNLENGSFLNSDNFDATILRFYSEG